MSLLEVNNLSVIYEPRGAEPTYAVKNASFSLERGEFVGLVGESGSGKSTLGFAVTRLAKAPARISQGTILFDGRDIANMDDEELRKQRQGGFAMVLQSGMNALNPVRSIRKHFGDIFAAHGHVPASKRLARAYDLVEKVELPRDVLDRFPGELSGGMRQRVSIALALSLEPQLMVFDEPTTALDVLVQHAVMGTIRELQKSENFTALLISHDLGIVLESTTRVMVMSEGVIVEDGTSQQILHAPQHEYTQMLLGHYADPRAEVVQVPGLVVRGSTISTTGLDGVPNAVSPMTGELVTSAPSGPARRRPGRPEAAAIVVDDVTKVYPRPRRGSDPVTAVDHVSFTLDRGQSMALVGASGSGKSTIAKLITGVERPTSGTILFGETRVDTLRGKGLRGLRQEVQMVFQDPYSALNPLHTVEYALMRPVLNYTGLRGAEARTRVLELLDTVGLTPVEQFAAKLPHQLSGGQRQRVVIARALACDPQVIIADEPVSMLDVSLRAGVLALLDGLRVTFGVSMLYITHDLLSARLVTDQIMVLNQGRVVESGQTAQVLRFPQDPYTMELLEAIPQPHRAGAGR
ncbi:MULTISPECIES: ABC transporter ATP-binding protein [unclassified Cryobacterium]|uniref:ABC transporter ATP-binding protein n=1 Tax=unclassified Cryobacterium TaxID=2649013 RepID=UPI00106AD70F|nr:MULTISPECIES: ABC transporter ATP-binding protein [unclassified Cryobacterium]TFC56674.1 ABC transporter ATP-binding protein [Cryobacterium sp. TMB3-1-2]TFC61129.1 ABC transporter ATP-binding protein [Cryobacterium sp. TMB1-7]TFC72180.1 ABC transporter ATP-binding protein [Cryobacterium sp. TMB3-15]TFC78803.1 ABC transporter ATP-binding protein [Cryobacterium sp. TMB3-10]TFD38596.1 ABC transporter ATP-binding protein [Cryobacterium sp. TMB3-12]